MQQALICYRRHPDLSDDLVKFVGHFATAHNQLENIYKNELRRFFNTPLDYTKAILDLLPSLLANCEEDIQ